MYFYRMKLNPNFRVKMVRGGSYQQGRREGKRRWPDAVPDRARPVDGVLLASF